MAMGDEKPLRWQDLSGEERYRVVELMRKGEVEIKQLCQTFGVSRQTLYRALEAADRAAVEALTRKRRGRKPIPVAQQQLAEIRAEKRRLEQALQRMSQKYEVAQALLDLQRKAERGERLPGEKKRRSQPSGPPASRPAPDGTAKGMADDRTGGSAQDHGTGADPVGPSSTGSRCRS
jgi:transposase